MPSIRSLLSFSHADLLSFSRIQARAQILVLLLLLGTPMRFASATTLARMSVEQMSRVATLVVRARCAGSTARWDHGEIWTFTAFTVTDTWKGNAAEEIAVRTPGGSAGNVTSHVAGVPVFRPGEDVVLFLEPSPAGGLAVVSWQQGTFRVHRDARTGRDHATQDLSAPVLAVGSSLSSSSSSLTSPSLLPFNRDETIEQLRREVDEASPAMEKRP
jgi:hypothetical protein